VHKPALNGWFVRFSKIFLIIYSPKNCKIDLNRVPPTRALRDGHYDFGRDWDGMDLKTAVWGRDRSGWFFSGFFEIFWDYKILFLPFNFAVFIHYDV
jgi:hypothetical protein